MRAGPSSDMGLDPEEAGSRENVAGFSCSPSVAAEKYKTRIALALAEQESLEHILAKKHTAGHPLLGCSLLRLFFIYTPERKVSFFF